jgi:hypothetical protein
LLSAALGTVNAADRRAVLHTVALRIATLPDQYDRWLVGDFDEAVEFQGRCFPDDLIEMMRTDGLWVKRKSADASPALM